MQDAARKINVPFVKKLEAHSKKAIDINGVIKEKAWMEFTNATRRVLTNSNMKLVILPFFASNLNDGEQQN